MSFLRGLSPLSDVGDRAKNNTTRGSSPLPYIRYSTIFALLLLPRTHTTHKSARTFSVDHWNDKAAKMKRSFDAMQASKSSSTKRSVRFSPLTVVYVVDCTETTRDLFYGKRDFSQFQTDFITEEKKAGNLPELQRRKRRQMDYQYETVAEIRRRRIEDRILHMIHQGQSRNAENIEQDDICFQRRCIPLQRVSMMSPTTPSKTGMAHAAWPYAGALRPMISDCKLYKATQPLLSS